MRRTVVEDREPDHGLAIIAVQTCLLWLGAAAQKGWCRTERQAEYHAGKMGVVMQLATLKPGHKHHQGWS